MAGQIVICVALLAIGCLAFYSGARSGPSDDLEPATTLANLPADLAARSPVAILATAVPPIASSNSSRNATPDQPTSDSTPKRGAWYHKPQLKIPSNVMVRGTAPLHTQCPPHRRAQGDVGLRLPRHFSSNMVIQRGMTHCLKGWVDVPGICVFLVREGLGTERISVVTFSQAPGEFNPEGKRTGRPSWHICLPREHETGPFQFRISAGREIVTLRNVAYGDVWVCGGLCPDTSALAPMREMPLVRVFAAKDTLAATPSLDVSPIDLSNGTGDPQDWDAWQPLHEASARRLSPLCAALAARLFRLLHPVEVGPALSVPLGIIQVMSPNPRFNLLLFLPTHLTPFTSRHCKLVTDREENLASPPNELYNSMISPILDFAIAGIVFITRQGAVPGRGACVLGTLARALRRFWAHFMAPMPLLVAGVEDAEAHSSRAQYLVVPTVDIHGDARRVGARAAELIVASQYRENASVPFVSRAADLLVAPPRAVAEKLGPSKYQLSVWLEGRLEPQPGCVACCRTLPLDVLTARWEPVGSLRAALVESRLLANVTQRPEAVRHTWQHTRQCRFVHPASRWPAAPFVSYVELK
eukprot:EG_transcript_6530